MILLEDLNIVYMQLAKVASQTVIATLNQPIIATREILLPELHERRSELTVVALTRNPYERLASCFEFMHRHAYPDGIGYMADHKTVGHASKVDLHTWEHFVADVCNIPDCESNEHYMSQERQLKQEGKYLPDRVYDLSNIEEFANDLQLPELRTRNETTYSDKSYYEDAKLKEAVYYRYKNDFDHFGYDE